MHEYQATITLVVLPGYPGFFIFALNVAGVHEDTIFPVTIVSEGIRLSPAATTNCVYSKIPPGAFLANAAASRNRKHILIAAGGQGAKAVLKAY